MRFIRLSICLGLLLAFVGCKEDYPVNADISFVVPVTITPSRRTMQRGDTLWLEGNFSDSLLDQNSGHRYRVRPQDLKFRSSIIHAELLGVDKEPVGIAPTFRFVDKIGRSQVQGSLSSSFEPVYDGNRYRVRIGLIPTKACITTVAVLLSPPEGLRGEGQLLPFIALPLNAEGRRQQAVLRRSYYIVNSGKANNYDLLLEHRSAIPPSSGSDPDILSIQEAKTTFTVEVK